MMKVWVHTGADPMGCWMDAEKLLSAMGVEANATAESEAMAELDGTKEALRIANEQITAVIAQRDKWESCAKLAQDETLEAKADCDRLRILVCGLEKAVDKQKQTIADVTSERDQLLRRIDEVAENDISDLKIQLSEMTEAYEGASKERDDLRISVGNLTKNHHDLVVQLDTLRSTLTTIAAWATLNSVEAR